jgi:hypothetical protein
MPAAGLCLYRAGASTPGSSRSLRTPLDTAIVCSKLHEVMICPQCKAEYRQGFTICADCEVDLVHSLPEAEEAASNRTPGGTLVPFWEGEDLALHTSLLEELDAASIPYYDRPMGVFPGARRGDHFPIQPMSRFGYQVAVLSSDLSSARRILEKLLEEEPANMELPVQDETPATVPLQGVSDEENTTIEVWTGSDEKLSEFLSEALRENEIPFQVSTTPLQTSIRVSSLAEARAREIVREIVEGAPPE